MHFEVEVRESDYADNDDGGIRHLGWRWRPFTHLNERGDEVSLKLVQLDDAFRLSSDWHPDDVRIVRVTDSDVREIVGNARSAADGGGTP